MTLKDYIYIGIIGILLCAFAYLLGDKVRVIERQDEQISELQTENEQLKTAMNFEKLFLLVAKPDSIMLLGDLQEQLKEKAGFCLDGD